MTANLPETEGFNGFSSLSTNAVELTDRSLQWASEVARSIPESSVEKFGQQRWQVFLETMAIAGFRQWLDEGALPLSSEYLSDRSQHANLQVGDYRLHIAIANTLNTQVLTLPAVGDGLADSRLAHLYVMVDVQEEVDQVQIIAGLWQEQLLQAVALGEGVRSLLVPLSAFTVEPAQILLCLSCLEPTLASATSAASTRASITDSIRASAQSAVGTVGAMTERVTSDFINARSWLQNQVDSAVEQIGWALLPPISPAMRPVKETVDVALDVLSAQGVQLPLQARGVGGPIALGSHVCQVYAWAWPVEAAVEDTGLESAALDPEWALFLLLGPSMGEALPQGIELEVSEGGETLTREVLTETSTEAYLFTQVQGAQSEQFVVKVILPERLEIVLPAFSFERVL